MTARTQSCHRCLMPMLDPARHECDPKNVAFAESLLPTREQVEAIHGRQMARALIDSGLRTKGDDDG